MKVTKGFADEKIYDIDDVPITEDITNIYHYLIDVKNLAPFSITPFLKCENKEKQNLNITANSISNDKISLEIKNSEIIIKDKSIRKAVLFVVF